MSTRNDILMPKLGLTMTEGMIAEWAVRPGDHVQPGQLMFVVETDKVATEIPATSAGEMLEILVEQGETVPVGAVVARWTGSGQSSAEPPSEAVTEIVSLSSLEQVQQVASIASDHGASQSISDKDQQPSSSGRIPSSPYARRLALEHGMTLDQVKGTGPRGRIKAQDVREAIDNRTAQPVSRPVQAPAAPFIPSMPSSGQPVATSGIVAAMAKRMVQAKQEVPHFYLSTEAEVTALLDLRETLNAQPGFSKLTVNHFLIAAVARALEDCPFQNRIWFDEQILQFDGVDVGIAVSTDRGLMAPVLHGLQGSSLELVAQRANELVSRVRVGQARREEMSGGAITISNAGMLNVTYMTPIINPPQSAILGVGSVREVFRPDSNGQPVIKREMGLVLACDHRLHDGSSGLKFLNVVVDYLQNPVWLLRSL